MKNSFDHAYYSSGSYQDYLQDFIQEGRFTAKKLIKKIQPLPDWRFLDVGCGPGGLVAALTDLGFKTQGTEISPYCLRHSPVKDLITPADITSLPFTDRSFQVVISMDVLCYLPRPAAAQAVSQLCRLSQHYLYLETIYQGSPNSSQLTNPDPLRLDDQLLTKSQIIDLVSRQGFTFLGPLFASEAYHDFNGLFHRS